MRNVSKKRHRKMQYAQIERRRSFSVAAYSDTLGQLYLTIEIQGNKKVVLLPKLRARSSVHYGIYWCGTFLACCWGQGNQVYRDFPWLQWELTRHTLLSDRLEEIANLRGIDIADYSVLCQAATTIHFVIRLRCGKALNINALIEEREYRRGIGWWKWLQHFDRLKTERQLVCAIDDRACLAIPLSRNETIPHAIWQYCRSGNLEFLPETYHVD